MAVKSDLVGVAWTSQRPGEEETAVHSVSTGSCLLPVYWSVQQLVRLSDQCRADRWTPCRTCLEFQPGSSCLLLTRIKDGVMQEQAERSVFRHFSWHMKLHTEEETERKVRARRRHCRVEVRFPTGPQHHGPPAVQNKCWLDVIRRQHSPPFYPQAFATWCCFSARGLGCIIIFTFTENYWQSEE